MTKESDIHLGIRLIEGFNPSKYQDPEYLNWCRFLAAQTLRNERQNPEAFKQLNQIMKQNGVGGQGVLLDEEIKQLIELDLPFPKPWSVARTKIDRPNKNDDLVGLYTCSVPYWAEHGYVVGMTSGKWDIFGPRYAYYLRECKKYCHRLVVGVDDNDLFKKYGINRPYNDFPVRLAAIAELPYVDKVHRISRFPAFIKQAGIPLLTYYYPEWDGDEITVDKAFEYKQAFENSNPEWYQKIAPNLRFFYTEGDPAGLEKEIQGIIMGAKVITIRKKFGAVSSSQIGERFGVQKHQDQTNKFGVEFQHLKYLNNK